MNSIETKARSNRSPNGQRGFSTIELVVVSALIFTIAAMALIQMRPSMAASQADNAMRQVMTAIRQAREYSITNRRYVEIQFLTVGGAAEVVTTQRNDQTANAGANSVLNTLVLGQPLSYCVCSMPDTPDGFGNTGAVVFESVVNGPNGGAGMWFQSDGMLVDSATFQPINGSVYLGVSGQKNTARAITVMGSTGRVHAYRSTGSKWFSF